MPDQPPLDPAEIKRMVTVMTLAAIQADGKKLNEITVEEMQVYVNKAIQDATLALESLNA